MDNVIIRPGIKEDLTEVLELVKELAEYERAPLEVTNTVSKMEEDGFGDNPIFGFFVAEKDKKIVGLSLYYYRYSTWKGRRLFLEDIIVTENERGKGIGKLLLPPLIEAAKKLEMHTIIASIDASNESSLRLHKSFGFEEVAHFKQVGYKFGRWLDLKFLQLMLKGPKLPEEG